MPSTKRNWNESKRDTMDDCPICGGEGFVYSTHYADPYATTRPCECMVADPDEKYEQQNEK